MEASAPGHVADVRELFLDALTRAQLQALAEANRRILLRIDPDGDTDPTRTTDPARTTDPTRYDAPAAREALR